MEITPDMAELIGAIIGDGNIYKDRYVEISGDAKLDIAYYRQRLLPIVERELAYTPSIRTGTFGARLRINNKNFALFVNGLGIQSGRGKTYNVMIPEAIDWSWELSKSCIRGIIDTDGCLSFDKRKIYVTPYPRIILHITSEGLSWQVYRLFSLHGYKPTFSRQMTPWAEAYTIYLSGKKQVIKYIEEIGFSNSRHLFKAQQITKE